jgi:hypothetical protein
MHLFLSSSLQSAHREAKHSLFLAGALKLEHILWILNLSHQSRQLRVRGERGLTSRGGSELLCPGSLDANIPVALTGEDSLHGRQLGVLGSRAGTFVSKTKLRRFGTVLHKRRHCISIALAVFFFVTYSLAVLSNHSVRHCHRQERDLLLDETYY